MSDNLNLQAKPMFSISLKPYEEENLAKEVVLTIGFEPEHPDAKDGIAKIFILDEEVGYRISHQGPILMQLPLSPF